MPLSNQYDDFGNRLVDRGDTTSMSPQNVWIQPWGPPYPGTTGPGLPSVSPSVPYQPTLPPTFDLVICPMCKGTGSLPPVVFTPGANVEMCDICEGERMIKVNRYNGDYEPARKSKSTQRKEKRR